MLLGVVACFISMEKGGANAEKPPRITTILIAVKQGDWLRPSSMAEFLPECQSDVSE